MARLKGFARQTLRGNFELESKRYTAQSLAYSKSSSSEQAMETTLFKKGKALKRYRKSSMLMRREDFNENSYQLINPRNDEWRINWFTPSYNIALSSQRERSRIRRQILKQKIGNVFVGFVPTTSWRFGRRGTHILERKLEFPHESTEIGKFASRKEDEDSDYRTLLWALMVRSATWYSWWVKQSEESRFSGYFKAQQEVLGEKILLIHIFLSHRPVSLEKFVSSEWLGDWVEVEQRKSIFKPKVRRWGEQKMNGKESEFGGV